MNGSSVKIFSCHFTAPRTEKTKRDGFIPLNWHGRTRPDPPYKGFLIVGHEKRRFELESPSNEIFLSAMSIAELMIKHSIDKIHIDFNPLLLAEKTGIEILSFSGADALLLGHLPMHHKDPFDRMIIAQSLVNSLPVMTDDSKFLKYDCKVV